MKRQKVKFRWLSTLATCLVLALCIGISIPLAGCNNTEAEAGTVTMEINPGVKYVITRDGNVMAVRFLNDDAEELLEEISLKGQSLRSALSLTVAAYKTAGFMESNDTVLISFDKKLSGDEKLKESVSEVVREALKKPSPFIPWFTLLRRTTTKRQPLRKNTAYRRAKRNLSPTQRKTAACPKKRLQIYPLTNL